jgi:3-phosphoshikimate 1-carboxyvinyltransferase
MSSPTLILLPRSKSIVIRCLIVNYIRTGTLLPVFDNDPNDIKVVYNALKIIDTRKRNSGSEECVIDVEDCGAAYRFLMALLAATPGRWLLTGTPRLLERPILPLVNFLNANGANIQKSEIGWRIEGCNVHIENIDSIETEETSQFASALMMMNAMCGMRCAVTKKQKAESRRQKAERKTCHAELVSAYPYLQMTKTIMQVEKISNSPLLKLADWSAAVFWIANALLTPNTYYLLKDLHFDNLQGDATIVTWFEQWGLYFSDNKLGIEVKHINHIEIPNQKIDVINTPDIAMILATLAVCYPFELTLSSLKNLNLKESNRLDIMVRELSKFTDVMQHSESQITIQKRVRKLPESFHFDSYNDHRFVMAWSLFKNFGTVEIINSDAIKKSYPDFNHQIYSRSLSTSANVNFPEAHNSPLI